MNGLISRRIELVSAWSGIAYISLLFIGWFLIAGFVPMHRPSAGAAEISAIFHADSVRIRIGMVVVMWAAVCMIPFGALIAHHVSRYEAPGRILTYMFVMAAFANAMLTFYPPLWWIIASYRATVRSVELTYLLNDIAWLQFIGGLSLIMPMFVVIPICALSDKSSTPLFPRWVGYFNMWLFVLVLPGQLLFFFYDGPFAWNGLFGIWLPLAGFVAWFLVTFHFLRAAALRRGAARSLTSTASDLASTAIR
jgi:hypothetical protein